MSSSSVRRQKVQADHDPLSIFLNQANTHEEEEEPQIEEVKAKTLKPPSNNLANTLEKEKKSQVRSEPSVQINNTSKVEKSLFEGSEAKPTPTQQQPTPNVVSVQSKLSTEKATPTIHSTKVAAPPVKAAPASVFESGDDIFLRVPKKSAEENPDDIFGSATALGELRQTNRSQTARTAHVYGGGEDSEDDDKLDDLAVGSLLEREELDFAMFGKSNVRQYDAVPPTSARPKIYKEDYTVQSEDMLNEMESLLVDSGNAMRYTQQRKTEPSFSSASAAPTTVDVDINAFDINAYINQQEEDSNVSLFG